MILIFPRLKSVKDLNDGFLVNLIPPGCEVSPGLHLILENLMATFLIHCDKISCANSLV